MGGDRRPGDIAVRVAAMTLATLGMIVGPVLLLVTDSAQLRLGDVRLQVQLTYLYWTVGAALMIAPFLALATVPGDWFERWLDAAVARVMAVPNRTFIAAAMAVAFGLSAFLAVHSFDRSPTSSDEVAQLWHARMLLEGRLAMPPDPHPEFFAIDNIIDRPLWMSQFPIGGPAILAIGLATGAVWLLNPLLTALIVFNIYRFAQRAFDEAQARAAVVLLLTSPMVLLVGASYMNHTSTAWLVTTALAALPLWTTHGRGAAVIGASLGGAIAIRPLDGVIASLVVGMAMLGTAARQPGRARTLLIALVSGAVPVALLLAANWRLNGHPMLFGYEVLWGPNHSLGLHPDPAGNPHTALRALLLAIKYVIQLNWTATGWPIPVVLLVVAGILATPRVPRWDVVLFSLFCAQLVAHAFYWHDGQFVGPRFLFTALPALLILAARAPFRLAERSGRGRAAWRAAIAIIPVCIGVAWLRPMKPFGVQAMVDEMRLTRSRFKVEPPLEVRTGTVQRALIFVQEGASSRLLHRMWGLGVSRPDALRLLGKADACSLVDAVNAESSRQASDTAGRVTRLEQSIRPYAASPRRLMLPDGTFRVSDSASVTPSCADEIVHDFRVKDVIAYGPMLLENRFGEDGRLGGAVVYAMDMRTHNEVLRRRFGDRTWYRYEVPRSGRDSAPVLVPYDTPR